MNRIQKAIEDNKHISRYEELNTQRWEEFEKSISQKKVFLFGIGPCADVFFQRNISIEIHGIIDNDMRKQGFFAGDFLTEAWRSQWEGIKVYSPEILRQYQSDEVVVLITSINYYENIVEQIQDYGISCYFVALIMEANERQKENYKLIGIDEMQLKTEYAKKCCLEGIDVKKILFYSFGNYSDHGKYITERILEKRKDLDIIWCVNHLDVQVPEGVRKVYMGNWKQYIYEMETARIWIYNMVIPSYVIKRSEQIYIQTKHWASVALKKFYLDALTIQDVAANVDNWRYNSRIMDYIITGSAFDTESCRRGFGFQKEVIQVGSPRSDALFVGDKYRKKVYKFYQIPLEVHTAIYAPTYRFNKDSLNHQHESREIELDFGRIKAALESRFGGEWYIILRLHPSVAKESNKIQKPNYVIDASEYEDSQELVAACEVMISDYSSIMFESAFVMKPVFLFAMDKKEYIDREYDLLIEYDTLPFSIAESNEELANHVETFDKEEYEKKVSSFLDKYGVGEDGKASERAANFISGLIDGKGKV